MTRRQQLTEEFLTCIVCHEVFSDPVTLHCGHTSCAECVTAFLKTQMKELADGTILCPICRGLTKVPDAEKPVEGWVGQIKRCSFVERLVESRTSDDEAGKRCSACIEEGHLKLACSHCSDCRKDLCADCDAFHRKMMTGHKTVKLEGTNTDTVVPSTGRCREHEDSPMDMMCEDCDEVLCQKCCIVYHRRCESVITLKQAVAKMDVTLQKNLQVLEHNVNKFTTDISLTKTKVSALQESVAKAKQGLDSSCETIIRNIRAKQAEMTAKLDSCEASAVNALKNDLKDTTKHLADARQKKELIGQVLDSDVHRYHEEVYRMCNPCNVEYQESAKDDGSQERVVRIDFQPGEFSSVVEGSEIGDIRLSQHTCENIEESSNVRMEDVNVAAVQKTVSTPRNRYYRSLDTLKTELPTLCGIVALVSGSTKITVCAAFKYVKAFYNKNGKQEHSVLYLESGTKDLSRCNDSEAVVLTDEGRKLVFFTANPVLKETRSAHLQAEYEKLAVMSSNKVAASRCERIEGNGQFWRIDVINQFGRMLKTFLMKDYQNISALTTTSNNRIVFLANSKLVCISDNGEPLFETENPDYINLYSWPPDRKKVCCLKKSPLIMDSSMSRMTSSTVTLMADKDEEDDVNLTISYYSNSDPLIAADSQGRVYISRSENMYETIWKSIDIYGRV